MQKNSNHLFARGVILAGLSWLCWSYRELIYYPDIQLYYGIGCFILGAMILEWVTNVLRVIPNVVRHWWVAKPKGLKGKAHWGGKADAAKAGLFRRRNRKSGWFMGTVCHKPIFVNIESSGMVLSPAGGGKGIGFVVPGLLGHREGSIIVSDVKSGELACQTARARKRKHKNKVHFLNPTRQHVDRLGEPSCYNPLQPFIDAWADPILHRLIVSDMIELSKQLLPEPPRSGENKFFRDGSRKLLRFLILYLIATDLAPTLTKALLLLSDMGQFESALFMAKSSEAFGGELARLATDLLTKTDHSDQRQLESFREGALQVLEDYNPGSVLAEATSKSDFRFADLKKEKITVYLIADPTQQNALKGWMGLVNWAAKTELMRAKGKIPVTFMLDEVTNFKIEGLPEFMTIARGYNIRIWNILQELEMWSHVYGKEGLDTLLSQTEVKLIHGARSLKTAEWLSKVCGERSIRIKSYDLGLNAKSDIRRNLSEQAQPMLPVSEALRLRQAILLHHKDAPMQVDIVGFHQIDPYRDWAQPNPHHGNKKFKGKVRVRL